jgi:hypothetical protein
MVSISIYFAICDVLTPLPVKATVFLNTASLGSVYTVGTVVEEGLFVIMDHPEG